MCRSRTAALARRTTPGPKSTRYALLSTTMAVAGPERSGSGTGVPVPSSTTRVRVACSFGGWLAGFLGVGAHPTRRAELHIAPGVFKGNFFLDFKTSVTLHPFLLLPHLRK